MPIELVLKVRLRIGSPLEGIHRDFEFSAAKGADSECRSGVKPFDDPNAALDHVSFSPIYAKDDPHVPNEGSKQFAELTGIKLKTLKRGGHISTDYITRSIGRR